MTALTLAGFLLARIAEKETWATERFAGATLAFDGSPSMPGSIARVLAECEAERAIIETHAPNKPVCYWTQDPATTHATAIETRERPWTADPPCPTLRALAAVHADHPDYGSWTC